MTKSETLSLRISPQAKALLAEAARMEHRSSSNLVEHLILTFCKDKGIELGATTPVAQKQFSPT